jgi:PTH2 family peptidyl-tRNA hydrolase
MRHSNDSLDHHGFRNPLPLRYLIPPSTPIFWGRMAEEPWFEWKQCIILRSDIKMSCGKSCAQACHAAVIAYERCDQKIRKKWFIEGQKKVVLKVTGERALFELKVLAEDAGISTGLVQDAGLTEIPPGTVTALGLGPAKSEDLDKITGGLSLL